jgi:hypothetical protein
MAESQIAGLFMTPEMYRQQKMQADRQRAAEYAQLAPEQRAAMGFFSAGQGLGRAAGTLLGAQDPQLQRITEQQQMLQGLDVSDPDSLMQAARRASQAGNVPLAMQLAGRAQEVAQGLATTRKAQLSLAQEQELREKLAEAQKRGATDEELLVIYSQYAPAGQAVQALSTRVNQREGREARAEEAERNRVARREALEERIASDERIARERGATQRELAQLKIDADRERDRLNAQLRREIAAAGGAGSGGTPFFQPVQTATGVFAFNARTGKVEPVTGPDGAPIVGATADPALQGTIAGARAGATAGVKIGTETRANISRSDAILGQIETAESLLDAGPTQSGIGAARDFAGRIVGYSPPSAQVASQLETLSGWLVANVPRMEGPQSNFDVKLYQEMAGKVGDRTVPAVERQAALRTLKRLQEKYRQQNQQKLGETPGASGSWDDGTAPAAGARPPAANDPLGVRRR